MDIDNDHIDGPTNQEIFEYIRNNLDFDQLINEFNYNWIHRSEEHTSELQSHSDIV